MASLFYCDLNALLSYLCNLDSSVSYKRIIVRRKQSHIRFSFNDEVFLTMNKIKDKLVCPE